MRHGKTDWNVVHKIQGRTDTVLNETGISAAVSAREEVERYGFEYCYCSPLKRAVKTATIVNEHTGLKAVIDERLIELGFGEFEGTMNIYRMPEHPLYKLFFDPDNYVAVNGCESLEELFERVKSFVDDRLKKHMENDDNVLIVGHGALNAALITYLTDAPLKDFWKFGQSNCSMFKYYPGDLERTLEENTDTHN